VAAASGAELLGGPPKTPAGLFLGLPAGRFCTLVFGFRIGASRRSAGPSCSAAWPSRDDETVAVAVGVDVAVAVDVMLMLMLMLMLLLLLLLLSCCCCCRCCRVVVVVVVAVAVDVGVGVDVGVADVAADVDVA
jgi:hypothetical protein